VESVYSAVRTESLYKTDTLSSLKQATKDPIYVAPASNSLSVFLRCAVVKVSLNKLRYVPFTNLLSCFIMTWDQQQASNRAAVDPHLGSTISHFGSLESGSKLMSIFVNKRRFNVALQPDGTTWLYLITHRGRTNIWGQRGRNMIHLTEDTIGISLPCHLVHIRPKYLP
jgi:hypothetical protein